MDWYCYGDGCFFELLLLLFFYSYSWYFFFLLYWYDYYCEFKFERMYYYDNWLCDICFIQDLVYLINFCCDRMRYMGQYYFDCCFCLF